MTNVGDAMLARSRVNSWGGPMWEEADIGAGGVYPGEAQLLYGLVRALRPLMILEVGTSHGYSTLHLAQAVNDNRLGHVYTVEIDEGRRNDAIQNLYDAGLLQHVLCMDRLSDTIGADFDFAFLDAGHTAADLREYLPYCKGAETIVIHDANYQNHVKEVMEGDYNVMIFPDTSHAGIAICQKR